MAKRRSGAKARAAASDRSQAAGSRRRAAGGGASGRSSQSKRAPKPADLRGQETQGRGQRTGGGFLSNAKDLAQSVGQTTVEAAQSTYGAARGAAGAVATRAQETASQVAGKVRENPWPSLLIGAGATWLAIDAVRGRSAEDTRPARGRQRSRRTGDQGAVGQAVSKVAEVGRAAGEQIEEFVRDRPLLAGAATLGLGMAVGMAMPSSVTENEMLGEVRDDVVRRARDAAKGTVQKVREVADRFEGIGPFGSASSSRGRER